MNISSTSSTRPKELRTLLAARTSDGLQQTESPQEPLWSSSLVDTVGIILNAPHGELTPYAEGSVAVSSRGPWKLVVDSPCATGVHALVRSRKDGKELYIEGSIPKFLTGQNLIGLESIEEVVPIFVQTVLHQVGIKVNRRIAAALKTGDYRLGRLDFAVHCATRDPEQASALMRALKTLVFQHARDSSFYGNDTIYIGQHSSRRTLRIYRKDVELDLPQRSLPVDHKLSRKVLENLPGLIRIELVLRSAELKRNGWDVPGALSPALLRQLMTRWIDRFARVRGASLDRQLVSKLTASEQTKLAAWALGDAFAFDRSPSTKAKTCRRILRVTGIDVRQPLTPDSQQRAIRTLQDLFIGNVGFREHRRAWLGMTNRERD